MADLIPASDRKSGSAGMPRPISYAVFCLKKKNHHLAGARDARSAGHSLPVLRRLSLPLLCHPLLFFFNHTATPEIYTLSLHDALPISACNVPSRSPLPALAIAPETKLGTASSGLGTLEP